MTTTSPRTAHARMPHASWLPLPHDAQHLSNLQLGVSAARSAAAISENPSVRRSSEAPGLPEDDALLQHLATTFGAATLAVWHELPALRLPEMSWMLWLWEQQVGLRTVQPTLSHLPWAEMILQFPFGRDPFTIPQVGPSQPLERDRGCCWMRLASLERYTARAPTASPWLRSRPTTSGTRAAPPSSSEDVLAPFRGRERRWLVLEVWEGTALVPGRALSTGTGGVTPPHNPRFYVPPVPAITLIDRQAPWAFDRMAHLFPNPNCHSGRAYGGHAGFCTISRCPFLAQGPQRDTRRAAPCLSSTILHETGVLLMLLAVSWLLHPNVVAKETFND